MSYLHSGLRWIVALLALSACAKSNTQAGSSETHFLALCNASCDDGFSCLCGVCTETCTGDETCSALDGNATCRPSADACDVAQVCDVPCSDDADCAAIGAQHSCEGGRCRAPLVMATNDAGAPPDQLGCGALDCVIDGICYPNGETTEDGCCTCEDGSYSCIEPGWCPSWPLLGKRCTADDDCKSGAESGLSCHASVSESSINICARDCNFGCPTGTECTHVEDYSGELCMRTCTSNADCNIEVFGEPLGSECRAGYCQ